MPKFRFLLWFLCWPATLSAAESWVVALSQMPLCPPVGRITWSNAVPLLLPALCSNQVVKALVFLPGATDEFYLYRRAGAELAGAAPSLFDAVSALTNQTSIRATFQPPILLLHTSADRLEQPVVVEHPATLEKLRRRRVDRALFADRDWATLEPFLRKHLKLDIRPWRGTPESWHLYRPCFAGWDLGGDEALVAAALATKAKVTIRRGEALFQLR